MITSEEIKTLKDRVGEALKAHDFLRNSDPDLVRYICNNYGYDIVKKASSIERCRRWYNQRGQYWPTIEKVAIQRKFNMEVWRKAMGFIPELPF